MVLSYPLYVLGIVVFVDKDDRLKNLTRITLIASQNSWQVFFLESSGVSNLNDERNGNREQLHSRFE